MTKNNQTDINQQIADIECLLTDSIYEYDIAELNCYRLFADNYETIRTALQCHKQALLAKQAGCKMINPVPTKEMEEAGMSCAMDYVRNLDDDVYGVVEVDSVLPRYVWREMHAAAQCQLMETEQDGV